MRRAPSIIVTGLTAAFVMTGCTSGSTEKPLPVSERVDRVNRNLGETAVRITRAAIAHLSGSDIISQGTIGANLEVVDDTSETDPKFVYLEGKSARPVNAEDNFIRINLSKLPDGDLDPASVTDVKIAIADCGGDIRFPDCSAGYENELNLGEKGNDWQGVVTTYTRKEGQWIPEYGIGGLGSDFSAQNDPAAIPHAQSIAESTYANAMTLLTRA